MKLSYDIRLGIKDGVSHLLSEERSTPICLYCAAP